ncbi:MAG: hypothetical protein ACTSRZ_09765 [Promethearchaeota archaeon]
MLAQDYFNYVFREILNRNKICYIQNHDQELKPFRGIELNPFEFLVFSEIDDRNFIIEIIGSEYPTADQIGGQKVFNYSVLGEINKDRQLRRIELEHTLIWQNIFKGNFQSLLVFIYIFKDYEAEKAFKAARGKNAFYFTMFVNYKFYEKKEIYGAILAVAAQDYLEYVNTNKIDLNDMKFKKEDAKKYLNSIVEFLPELKK